MSEDDDFFNFVDLSKKRYVSDETRDKISNTKKGIKHSDAHRNNISKVLRDTQSDVIQKFNQVHGNRYDYSKVEYLGSQTKIIIICSDHGEFLQIPNSHLNGRGCPKCGRIKANQSNSFTTDEIIKSFQERRGDRYDYSKVDYKNDGTKVTIICPDHGEFLQVPNSHKKGVGCPKCRKPSK